MRRRPDVLQELAIILAQFGFACGGVLKLIIPCTTMKTAVRFASGVAVMRKPLLRLNTPLKRNAWTVNSIRRREKDNTSGFKGNSQALKGGRSDIFPRLNTYNCGLVETSQHRESAYIHSEGGASHPHLSAIDQQLRTLFAITFLLWYSVWNSEIRGNPLHLISNGKSRKSQW
jgi:hypothetical protein